VLKCLLGNYIEEEFMKKENPAVDFVALEHEILEFWEKERCFERLVEKNAKGKRFRFLDGPITANNAMGIHHAWGRTLKDVNIRYNAMHGKSCHYQNGFDSQGLWVEVEAEKEIGIKDKRGIVEYGLANFTEKCMERVRRFSAVITEQSKRLGQWMDWDNSYFTNTDLNITSIWHFLKTCHEQGLLVKKRRPMPWCPRCGTSLSEHEMSGSYKDVEHTSIYAVLPIKNSNDSILVWTTTPWTLTSNVALAVNPEITYVRVKVKSTDRTLIIGKAALGKLRGDIIAVESEFSGAELVGKEYQTVFPEFSVQNFTHKIVPWEDVDASEGTGVVHIAPGCGAEDYDLGVKLSLPQICPIDDAGIILEGFGNLTGVTTKDAFPLIVERMKKDGTLYNTEAVSHSYPHCWRCKHEVVFKLVDEWAIATESLKPRLIKAANTVKWEPDFAGKRMVDWLTTMGDWNISRKRFYGLPLPFYPCKSCGHLTVVGSKEELAELSENKNLDGVPHLHRPYIDTIKIVCPKCGKLVERVPEVGDCWLDAGIAPFSTKGYFTDKKFFKENFPSELVIEMKEQIRLWFYSLLFMSTVILDKAPYERVVTHGSVIKEDGGKFSKTGDMIRFDEAAEKMGADTVRYLFCSSPITGDVRFGYNLADEARRKVLSFWNVYVFFNLYASLDNPDISSHKLDFHTLTHSDKWLLERVNAFIEVANDGMEKQSAYNVIKEFEAFTDDVSNWYIRINRKRFWKSVDKVDQLNAYACLYRALKASIGVMAPILPFLTDYIWQNTVREIEKDAEISVHLSKYPEPFKIHKSDVLNETETARNVINIALKMRNEAQIKVKQPLKALYIVCGKKTVKELEPLLLTVKEELNVKSIEFKESDASFSERYYTVNFRVAGARLKGEAQKLKTLVDGLNADGMADLDKQVAANSVNIGEFTNLESALFDAHERPKKNFVVVKERELTLAIDTEIDDTLRSEGFARETIRQIQVMRKEAGFAVEQRIKAWIETSDNFASVTLKAYADKIAQDILAVSLNVGKASGTAKEIEVGEVKIKVTLEGH